AEFLLQLCLQAKLQQELGTFPFFNFWGPTADIRSSKWIAACARRVFDDHRPTLSLVYLPHLDYNLQRLGPSDPAIRDDVAAIDTVAGELIDHVRGAGAEVLVVSEYGISDVTGPVHINRVLRDNGYIAVRETLGWELLDCGASRAFAVADHQVAHVYVRDPSDVAEVAALLARTDGIEHVLDEDRLRAEQLDHARSGQLVAVAEADRWFSYYYWLDDTRAPDFAPTVDIHRKPGYDPAEMFVDPAIRFPKLKAGLRVAQKKLGFRMLMDMIPLNADMVRGSHGRHAPSADTGPLAIGSRRDLATDRLPMTGIKALMLNHW
ncbi:MAG: alkaline phosphatase family protein, partial [Pseudomonadota bacterium]